MMMLLKLSQQVIIQFGVSDGKRFQSPRNNCEQEGFGNKSNVSVASASLSHVSFAHLSPSIIFYTGMRV